MFLVDSAQRALPMEICPMLIHTYCYLQVWPLTQFISACFLWICSEGKSMNPHHRGHCYFLFPFLIYKETRPLPTPSVLNKARRSHNLAIKITEVKALVVYLFFIDPWLWKANKIEFSWWPDMVISRKWWRTLWSCQRRLALRLWSVRWEHCAQGCHYRLPIWSWIRWWS